jgi:hypothetical protein
MDPDDMLARVEPVARGQVDYAKANRLITGQAWQLIPRYRYLGNAVLSLMTKIASGYWHVADSQSGFTAISNSALRELDLDRLWHSYGYPNDLLVQLNVRNIRVEDVPTHPRYGVGERSSMKIWKVIPTVSYLLWRRFMGRLFIKYVIKDFHPLVFFYFFGLAFVTIGTVLGLLEIVFKFTTGGVATATIVLDGILLVSGLQFLLFAMWFDMEYNKTLKAAPKDVAGSVRRAD